MPEIEKRSEFRKVDIRAEVDGKKLVLRGYPILFNVATKIYDWYLGEIEEIILPTALNETDLTDVYLIGGHNPDNLFGRNGKNMRLEIDETGLFFECEMPNTQLARDWYNLVVAEILDGMSFSFKSGDTVNDETKTRTITNISELFEITLTPFPAYKEASVVAKRKLEIETEKRAAEKKEMEARAAEKLKVEQLEKELRAEKLKKLEAM